MYSRNIVTDGFLSSDMLGSTCLPGSKIFVSTEGTFYPCEKISDKFPIGNCEYGLDEQKICELVNRWSYGIQENC